MLRSIILEDLLGNRTVLKWVQQVMVCDPWMLDFILCFKVPCLTGDPCSISQCGCVILKMAVNIKEFRQYICRNVKMGRQPSLSMATLRPLPPVNYLKNAKKWTIKKVLKYKNKKKFFQSYPACSFLWSTFPTWEKHIPSAMCFPTRETHIPSAMCSPTWETHISSGMCSLPGKHISLVVCVLLPGKHISQAICLPLPGKHISLVVCVPLSGKHTSVVVCVPLPGIHISLVVCVALPG